MSRSYPRDFIDELKMKANIVDIVSMYTEVKKVGSNYLALCTFHQENNPSMQLNPDQNTFYCHACGAGSSSHSTVKSSDVISFIQHMQNIDFPSAIEYLANLLNESLPILNPEEQRKVEQEKQYFDLMKRVAEAFHYNLKENEKVLDYLRNRGITDLDIDIWKLGYGGEDPHKEFVNVKNRIVFPLFDYDGNIVSFTGRVPFSSELLRQLNENNEKKGTPFVPKYKDKKGFNKNDHLYGIHIAKEYIREFKTAVLVEGWTDVISLHRHGLKHTVSTMGVALSQNQINLIKRAGANKVILMRDGDEAGVLASERDSKLLHENDLECFIYPLENGMDPDTLCLSFGYYNETLINHINKFTLPISQYKIAKIFKETQEEIIYHYNLINQTQEERINKVIDVLLTIEDPVELDLYIRQASEMLVVSYDAIKEKVNLKKKELNSEFIPRPAFQPIQS